MSHNIFSVKVDEIYLYRLNVPTKAAGFSTSTTFFLPNISLSFSMTASKSSSIPIFNMKRMPTNKATPTLKSCLGLSTFMTFINVKIYCF